MTVGEAELSSQPQPEPGQWCPPPSAFLMPANCCNMLFKEFLIPVPDESRDSLFNAWGTTKYPYSAKLVKFEDNLLIVRFDTAWSPPIPIFENLTHKWGFSVNAVFFEPNMDIAGVYTSEEKVISGKGFEYYVLLSELMGTEPPRHDGQRKLNVCLRADGGTTLGCQSFEESKQLKQLLCMKESTQLQCIHCGEDAEDTCNFCGAQCGCEHCNDTGGFCIRCENWFCGAACSTIDYSYEDEEFYCLDCFNNKSVDEDEDTEDCDSDQSQDSYEGAQVEQEGEGLATFTMDDGMDQG